MTQEEKQLLLKDLCARLPYGVHGAYSWKCGNPYERELTGNLMSELINSFDSTCDSEFKPYLRPMSSMTEEEENEFISLNAVPSPCLLPNHTRMSWYSNATMTDWLNEHHFDYRGLIEKGLAIEVTEENNPYV